MSFTSKCQKVCQEFFTGVNRKEFKDELIKEIADKIQADFSEAWEKDFEGRLERERALIKSGVKELAPDIIRELLNKKNE